MEETKLIDVQALLEEAKSSEHKESSRVLESSHNYRIGVGARLAPSGQPSFFPEVLIHLCLTPPESSSLNGERAKGIFFISTKKFMGNPA